MDPAKCCPEFRKQCIAVIATIPICRIGIWRSSFIALKPESLTSKERQVCVCMRYKEQKCTTTKILQLHRVHENSNIEAQAMHCTENPIYVFLKMKLRGLTPNSYIHTSVSDLCFPRISLQKLEDGLWEYINRSQIYECGN
jgi:hypothetical protein